MKSVIFFLDVDLTSRLRHLFNSFFYLIMVTTYYFWLSNKIIYKRFIIMSTTQCKQTYFIILTEITNLNKTK